MYYCCICKFPKELFSIVSFETWCKGKDFYFYLPNFFEVFFDLFFRKSLSERLQDIRLDLPTSSLSFYLSDFLRPLSSCHHRISLDCGCKSTAVKHILQMFSQLFYNYFLLSLIVNDLQMHFSPFFWLDPKETKTSLTICFTPSPFGQSWSSFVFRSFLLFSPFNSQFSIFNLQLSIDQKPTFWKQLNENRFQSSLDLLSIPV